MADWMESLKATMGVYWELLFLFLGGLIGWGIPALGNKINESMQKSDVRKKVKKIGTNEDINILTINSGMPSFDLVNVPIMYYQKKYFIGFPQHLREDVLKVDPQFEMHDDFIFYESNDFERVGKIMEIEDFPQLVEKHRELIAQDFLHCRNGCLNNRLKFGVYSLNVLNGIGQDEEAGAEFELYQTDYFTHRVMRSIYYELKERGHAIACINAGNLRKELPKYNVFTTSLGINLYLVTNSAHGKSIIFSQRSQNVAHRESRMKYNSTVMEGISQADLDGRSKRVSLTKAAERALEEELGIEYDLFKPQITYYDIFIHRDYFEIGFTATAQLDVIFETMIQDLPGKDKSLEVARLVPVALNRKSIGDFVKQHKFYPQGLYTLKMLGARYRIFIEADKDSCD